MIIPRWRNLVALTNSSIPTLSTTATTTHSASFHSTPVTCEKWKNKWSFDVRGAQQPSKNYVRYATRQKRADTKRALKDLLFNSGYSKISFQDENPMWNFDGRSGRDSNGSDKNHRSMFSGQRSSKSPRKKMKRRHRREGFSEDFDHTENVFHATFGNRWYTRSFREDSSFRSSTSGFEWREHANWTNSRTRQWDYTKETESDDESYTVGLRSDRTILGLPATGPLKIEDVKNAFRLSALKWHPDKYQGPSQAMAEEKFKLCLDAYKSLCTALT